MRPRITARPAPFRLLAGEDGAGHEHGVSATQVHASPTSGRTLTRDASPPLGQNARFAKAPSCFSAAKGQVLDKSGASGDGLVLRADRCRVSCQPGWAFGSARRPPAWRTGPLSLCPPWRREAEADEECSLVSQVCQQGSTLMTRSPPCGPVSKRPHTGDSGVQDEPVGHKLSDHSSFCNPFGGNVSPPLSVNS